MRENNVVAADKGVKWIFNPAAPHFGDAHEIIVTAAIVPYMESITAFSAISFPEHACSRVRMLTTVMPTPKS